jgi:hypothetical protein
MPDPDLGACASHGIKYTEQYILSRMECHPRGKREISTPGTRREEEGRIRQVRYFAQKWASLKAGEGGWLANTLLPQAST